MHEQAEFGNRGEGGGVKDFACVIGTGPAGLMAAEVLAAGGMHVILAEAKPSLGRKFLMAGRSGLNITKAEDPRSFAAAYRCPPLLPHLARMLPQDVQDWVRGLGQPVFTGSSGRVFPVAMKASPLVRAIAGRLGALGVEVRTGWRWTGWAGGALAFATPGGRATLTPRVTVLALGGASWPRLGADAAWVPWLAARGVAIAPFRPANMGFDVDWDRPMDAIAGTPVKPVAVSLGTRRVRGEFVVTRTGVEGGAIYALSRDLRDALGPDGVEMVLDLLPDRDLSAITAALGRPRGRASMATHLTRTLRLSPVKRAVLMQAGPVPADPGALAARLKALPLRLTRPRPIAEAISVAGGVCWGALDPRLMLHALPGVFCAGEMIDWEAPTGGYLITACLATGRAAGDGALAHARG